MFHLISTEITLLAVRGRFTGSGGLILPVPFRTCCKTRLLFRLAKLVSRTVLVLKWFTLARRVTNKSAEKPEVYCSSIEVEPEVPTMGWDGVSVDWSWVSVDVAWW